MPKVDQDGKVIEKCAVCPAVEVCRQFEKEASEGDADAMLFSAALHGQLLAASAIEFAMSEVPTAYPGLMALMRRYVATFDAAEGAEDAGVLGTLGSGLPVAEHSTDPATVH
jgi:hypothetical protein